MLTHHAVAAADARRAHRYAREAAEEAARAGSHTEAVAFYETALATLPGDDPRERATLLTRLGHEQYMTSRLTPAIATVSATFPLWQDARDDAGLSSAHESCAVFEYYNARRVSAEAHADRAAALARGTTRAYGAARVTRGYLAYHRGDVRLATQCTADAGRIAAELGDDALALRSRLVDTATDLALGERRCPPPAGRRSSRRRVSSGSTSSRPRATRTSPTSTSSSAGWPRPSGVLEQSLAFTVERDIPICNHWQTGVRSRLRLLEGRWAAALEDADDALARTGMPLATFWPHLVAGLVRLRRDGTEDTHLEAAWQLADRLDEPMKRLPALSALAERMWLTGQPDGRVTHTAPAELDRAAGSSAVAWSAGDLAVWLARLGIPTSCDPEALADPWRLALTGHPEDAAAWWRRSGVRGRRGAWRRSTPRTRRCGCARVEQLDRLRAAATADRLRRILRQEGVTQLPVRPRAATRANPSGLTNRQLDVAKLVARGFTNAEIADAALHLPQDRRPPRVRRAPEARHAQPPRRGGAGVRARSLLTRTPRRPMSTWPRNPPRVGDRASMTRTLQSADIVRFTELSGDRNPVHYDEEAVARTSFGRIVVQGGVSSAILNAVVAERLPGPGTVFLETNWRFLAPTHPGDTITGEVEVTAVRYDKPITTLATRVVRGDGVVAIEGTAVCWTMDLGH